MKLWDDWANSLSIEEIMTITNTRPDYDQTDFQYKTEFLEEWNKLHNDQKHQIWFDNNNEF